MPATTTTDVLVCGAGAAGLTLAIDLARRGVDFRLVEQREAPFEGSRGKGLQPRTLEVFEDLGFVDRILAVGGPYPPQRRYLGDGVREDSPIVEAAAATPAEPYALPWMSPQWLTEEAMRERLAALGRQVEFGQRLVDFRQDADGVTATLAGPDGAGIVRARYLVGTDGGRSFVRQALGIGFPGKTLGVRGLVADVELEGLDRDAWHRFGEGAAQIGFCPLAGTGLFQIQAPVPLEGEVDVSTQGLGALAAGRTGRDDIRVRAVRWASAYAMNARLADRYRIGRVFLAGDAAHVHPPTGGQGLNTSVQDAYNFGWKLAAALEGAPDALLDSYEEERRPIAADVLGLSTRLLDAAKRDDLRRGREARQLDLGYRAGPLALERPDRAHGLRAGDRAPDAPLRRIDGEAVRLFELLAGPHWTLLGYQAGLPGLPPRPGLRVHAIAGAGDLVDAEGHFREAYALDPGDWILLRPDGYVGAIVGAGDIDALEEYLARCLPADASAAA